MVTDAEVAAAQTVLRDGKDFATPGPEFTMLTTAKVKAALEAAEKIRNHVE